MQSSNLLLKGLFSAFFWIFNATLTLIVYVGVLPFIGFALLGDAVSGTVPLNFLLGFVGLLGVPLTFIVGSAVIKRWRQTSLFQLFYGIEAPLLLVCMARFFVFQDLTTANALLLTTIVVGAIALDYWFATQQEDAPQASVWHLVGQTLILAIALYMLVVAAFYVPPFLTFVPEVVTAIVYGALLLPLTVVALGFCSLPLGMAVVYGRSWYETVKQLGARHGIWKVGGFAAVSFAAWFSILLVLLQQPQVEAFRLLSKPPQTEPERQALLQKSDGIRSGLLNAYLSTYRYPRIQNRSMGDFYQSRLGVPDAVAETIQQGYDWLMTPFTYQGTREDVDRAVQLYAQFFDAPILRQEFKTVQAALQSTFNRSQAKAGLDDINQERVWLEEQRISVTPEGDWAEVEIQEVYQNKTSLPEEVLYYFSLPESAAITGVWLSDDIHKPKKYPFVISPRGAAQQVYSNQVVRNVDPALLEQVGPQQYRLRAYPVPVAGATFRDDGSRVPQPGKLYLWLRYRVLKQESGWQLPELRERRNVFWTGATKRLVNGKTVAPTDRWLPAALPAVASAPVAHQLKLPWGAQVLAVPFGKNDYRLPQGKRFAIVVDTSRSMEAHRQELVDSFRWLKDTVLKQNTADLYITTIANVKPTRIDNIQQSFGSFDPAKTVFYGMVLPKEMLAQFRQLQSDTRYDAVLLITDAGSYELNNDTPLTGVMLAPVWMVHLGGLAFGYDDATLKAIQDSDGGVATQLQTVMQRIGTQPTRGPGTSFLNLLDGYAWFLTQDAAATAATSEGFGALAARQWITHLSRYLQPNEMRELDAIHETAQRYGIVSPYSSMIVLVNDRQRQELKRAEQQDDRFDREVEDQQLPQTNPVSAVPEPTEWLLLLVACGGIGAIARFQRQSRLRENPFVD